MKNMKIRIGFFLGSLILGLIGPVIAENWWHEPVIRHVRVKELPLSIPLTSDWRVTESQDKSFTAANSRLACILSIRAYPSSGLLEKALRGILSGFTLITRREVQEEDQSLTEFVAENRTTRELCLGRALTKESMLVVARAVFPQSRLKETGDEVWLVIRGFRFSGKPSRLVEKGKALYTSPKGDIELLRPETWQIKQEAEGTTFHVPKGLSFQVIPREGGREKRGEEIIADFLNAFLHTARDFKARFQDKVQVGVGQAPRLVYEYRFPDGTRRVGWAIGLALPLRSYLFVCDAPEREYEKDAAAFLAVLESVEILP